MPGETGDFMSNGNSANSSGSLDAFAHIVLSGLNAIEHDNYHSKRGLKDALRAFHGAKQFFPDYVTRRVRGRLLESAMDLYGGNEQAARAFLNNALDEIEGRKPAQKPASDRRPSERPTAPPPSSRPAPASQPKSDRPSQPPAVRKNKEARPILDIVNELHAWFTTLVTGMVASGTALDDAISQARETMRAKVRASNEFVGKSGRDLCLDHVSRFTLQVKDAPATDDAPATVHSADAAPTAATPSSDDTDLEEVEAEPLTDVVTLDMIATELAAEGVDVPKVASDLYDRIVADGSDEQEALIGCLVLKMKEYFRTSGQAKTDKTAGHQAKGWRKRQEMRGGRRSSAA